MEFKNKDIYIGDWKNDIIEGNGEYSYFSTKKR